MTSSALPQEQRAESVGQSAAALFASTRQTAAGTWVTLCLSSRCWLLERARNAGVLCRPWEDQRVVTNQTAQDTAPVL